MGGTSGVPVRFRRKEAAMHDKHPIDDAAAMRIAEATDVSPKQAAQLLRKHQGDFRKALEEARLFRAES